MNKYFQIGQNFTEIEKMLLLVRKYGFAHVCANREFDIKKDPSLKTQPKTGQAYSYWKPYLNYPHLDFRIQASGRWYSKTERFDIDFYFRGALDQEQEAEFQNLFEYLLSRSFVGTGFLNFFKEDFFICYVH